MKLVKQLTNGDALNQKIKEGVEKAYILAKAGYGPKSGNVLLEQLYGDPMSSHDGITNLSRYFDEDPIVNMTIRSIVQASQKNDKRVGDGTTGVAILAHALYQEASKLVGSNFSRMEVSELINDSAEQAIKQLIENSKPFDNSMIEPIAYVSSGLEGVAKMLSSVFSEIGAEGHILIEDSEGDVIEDEVVNGFYFDKGFTYVDLANNPSKLESRHYNVPIILSEKRFTAAKEIAPILSELVKNGHKEAVFIGEVTEQALMYVFENQREFIRLVLVEPMHHEGFRSLFLNDLAIYIDAKKLPHGFNPSQFTIDMAGMASSVVINSKTTTIFGGDGSPEDVEARLHELESELQVSTNQIDINNLNERISRLRGKMAKISVGAPTSIEQMLTKMKIQDAIEAVHAAPTYGVLPAGGVALARLKLTHFTEAYQSLIKCLADNAELNSEKVLATVLDKPYWYGYNFKIMRASDPDYRPTNLFKAKLYDPTEVVVEIVRNAASIASTLITTSAALTFVNRDEKEV